MAEMKAIIPQCDTITLDGRSVDALIRCGNGGAALLYLYLLRTGGTASMAVAAKTLRQSPQDISTAMEQLKMLGLLQADECNVQMTQGVCGTTSVNTAPVNTASVRLQKEELPEYSVEDIKRELDNGSIFTFLVQEVQKSLGKILSSDELVRLFGLYDSLGLPPEVILHLVTYCIDENRRRYGQGRVPTIRYIEKVAFTWEREGIITLEKAESYIKTQESRRAIIGDMKKILQIKDRELTASERRFVDNWIAQGFAADVIELAYDRTLIKTGRLAWSYMDSILCSWHQKGLGTVADIEKKDVKVTSSYPEKKVTKQARPTAPTQSDIEHMKKFLEKLREE